MGTGVYLWKNNEQKETVQPKYDLGNFSYEAYNKLKLILKINADKAKKEFLLKKLFLHF